MMSGFPQDLEDEATLVRPADLNGLAEDAPAASFAAELDGGLDLLDVATAPVQGHALRVAVEDEHGVGCPGKPEGAGNLLKGVDLARALAQMMHYDDGDAGLRGDGL
jgi:hypothetical protein